MNTDIQHITNGWRAAISLDFQVKSGKTILARNHHYGPLRVQRAFYPEKNSCHVYLLHPPGGVVGGDQLNVDCHLLQNSQVLITTPAANKFYRSNQVYSQMKTHCQIDDNATLEWLPQESIVFNGSHANNILRIDLGYKSHFIGWEIMCLGRPAIQETFDSGHISQSFEIWRQNKPLWIDRTNLAGGSKLLTSNWGLAGYPVCATMVIVMHDESILNNIREILGKSKQHLVSVTQLNSVMVCRYLGHDVQRAKYFFIKIWELTRPILLNQSICPPRIWNT